MTKATSSERREPSLARDWLRFVRYQLGGRRTVLAIMAVAVIGGFALNWSWLVATGLASLLLALLPCAVMCALGLCMHRLAGKRESGGQARHEVTSDRADDQPEEFPILSEAQDCCGGGGKAAEPTEPQAKVNDRRDSHD